MRVLVNEARELGVDIKLSCQVSHVDCRTPYVELGTGERIAADVVIGADGLNSVVRGDVLGQQVKPVETGDLAYRAIIPRSKVESLDSPVLNPVLYEHHSIVWWGPDSHAVLYPVRHAAVFNLVLLVPDDLPPDVDKVPGNIDQMKKLFQGWDPILRELIEQVPSSLKWKLVSFDALETWTSGSCTLLGDACHPTLPYQAQGAAMAVEDGASIAKLVGLAVKSKASVPQTLQLYERLRKDRTMLNVKGARDNRALYHARDGEPADRRNAMLKDFDWSDTNQKSAFGFNDPAYQMALMGFDTVKDAEDAFEREFGTRNLC
ncbi:hypothetical protein LTR85_011695 [Meristemomyces frigidus]|nr:hypothetical protein LTR85_011695 [Meristemomyces frigidus]